MKKYLIIMSFLFLILPGSVYASSLKLNCDSTNVAGNVLSCGMSLTLDEDVTYNKLEAVIKVDNSSSITFEAKNGVDATINDNNLVINGANVTDFGSLKIKFPSEASGSKNITVSALKLYNDDNLVASLDDAVSKVNVKSSVNTLKSLSVSNCDNCTMSPSFKSNTTVYIVYTKSNKITISASANGSAKVIGAGTKNLTKDSETFKITVTSESGSSKVYKVIVNKEKSNDISLASLTIDKGTLSPAFSRSVTSYSAVVDSDKVVIKATASDTSASVSGTGEKSLEYGRNEFTVTVTGNNGNTKNYLITISRPDTRNANAYLKSLTIDGKDIEFEKDIVEYEYKVGKNVDSLDIKAVPELESSKVEMSGNEKFQLGKNTVTITVKAEDNSEKVYKIIVIKEENVSDDLYLDNLKIKGYDINFDKEKFEYTLKIKNEKELDIIAFASNGYKTEIVGNESLKDSSIIKIIVSDEDGNSNVYKIKIEMDNNEVSSSSNSDDINYIPYIMTSLLVILFILDLIQVIKRLRNK